MFGLYKKSSKIGARKALISESMCAVYKAFLKIATPAELNPGAYDDSGNLKWQNTIFVSEKDAFSALDDNIVGVDSTFTWSEKKKFKAATDALCNMRPPALEQYDKGKYLIHISSIVKKLKRNYFKVSFHKDTGIAVEESYECWLSSVIWTRKRSVTWQ